MAYPYDELSLFALEVRLARQSQHNCRHQGCIRNKSWNAFLCKIITGNLKAKSRCGSPPICQVMLASTLPPVLWLRQQYASKTLWPVETPNEDGREYSGFGGEVQPDCEELSNRSCFNKIKPLQLRVLNRLGKLLRHNQ